MAPSTVTLLPPTPSPFTVRLVLAGSDQQRQRSDAHGSLDPFERVGDHSENARIYRAQLVARTGVVIDELVLKIPPPPPWRDEDDEPLTNGDLERRWAARRRDVQRLHESPSAFLELVLPSEPGDQAAPLRLPVLLYCPRAQRLFQPICLTCRSVMATCRDDGILARFELPLHSTTDSALLYCPDCIEEDDEPLFVSSREVTFELPDDGCTVIDLPEYMKRLTTALAEPTDPATTAAATIPCAACADAASCCQGNGNANQPRWWTFTEADTPYLLTRRVPMPFDQLVDSIGGADERLDRRLFSDSGHGLDAVEILLLKIRLFRQMVHAVREYYRLLGLPHLDLNPAHLVGGEGGGSADGLPLHWQSQVRLIGGSSARLRTLSDTIQVVIPPRRPQAPFYSPRIRDFLLTAARTGQLVLDRLVRDTDNGRCRFEARLSDPHGVFPHPTPDDWIELTWREDPIGLGVTSIVARLDPRTTRKRSGQLTITTEPITVEDAVAERLDRIRGATLPAVRYRVYPVFGLHEDLYSLGVLFLRILVVNDRQDLAAVEEILTHLSAVEGEEIGPGDDLASLAMSTFPETLAKTQLFFRDLDRQGDRPNAVPEPIWKETLGLALSVVTAEDVADDVNPTAYLDTVRARCHRLEQTLRSILFDRQPAHLQVRSVIAELLAEEQRHRKSS